jgi:hypothetical protein
MFSHQHDANLTTTAERNLDGERHDFRPSEGMEFLYDWSLASVVRGWMPEQV